MSEDGDGQKEKLQVQQECCSNRKSWSPFATTAAQNHHGYLAKKAASQLFMDNLRNLEKVLRNGCLFIL